MSSDKMYRIYLKLQLYPNALKFCITRVKLNVFTDVLNQCQTNGTPQTTALHFHTYFTFQQ